MEPWCRLGPRRRAVDLANRQLIPLITRTKDPIPIGTEVQMRAYRIESVYDPRREMVYALYSFEPDAIASCTASISWSVGGTGSTFLRRSAWNGQACTRSRSPRRVTASAWSMPRQGASRTSTLMNSLSGE